MKTTTNQKTMTFILVVLLMIIFPAGIFAQQVIKFKSGYEYRAIIVRQTADTVRYQLISNPDVTIASPMSQIESISQMASLRPVHDKTYWEKRVTKYSRICIAGGGLLIVGGIVTAVNYTNRKEGIDNAEDFQQKWGWNLVGTACLVTGAVLTISGGVNVGIGNKELKKLKVEMEANPVISGVTLRVRF